MAWLAAMKQICRKCLIKSKTYTTKQLSEMDKEIKIINAKEKIIYEKNREKYLTDHK